MTCTRNYKKQSDARNLKYKRFEVNVEELEGIAFKNKLIQDNTNFMEWARKQIKEYLKNDEQY